MTYYEALLVLVGRPSRKIGNNTQLVALDNHTIAVRLYATDVVLIHWDGTYTLNTGGWRTVTTKQRINRYSPARVYSERGKWFVGLDAKTRSEFRDGVRVDSKGAVIG